MSGVYQRNREVSEYKFFTQAIAIRVEVNKLMASSSVVPKAYRLLNAVPTVETARSIVYNVNRADCFYPNSSFNALERKRYLTLAIADCEQLMLDMQCLMDIGLPVNANRFEALAGMVEEEIKLLKGARKNVRVTGKKTTDERIAEAEAELERLRSLYWAAVPPCISVQLVAAFRHGWLLVQRVLRQQQRQCQLQFGDERLGSPPPRIPLLPDRVGPRAESRARRGRKARPSGSRP